MSVIVPETWTDADPLDVLSTNVNLFVPDSVSVPLSTSRLTLTVLEPSATEIRLLFAALKTRSVSSSTVCAPGSVLTGASLTAETVMDRVAMLLRLLAAAPSLNRCDRDREGARRAGVDPAVAGPAVIG